MARQASAACAAKPEFEAPKRLFEIPIPEHDPLPNGMDVRGPIFFISRKDYDAVLFDLDGVVTRTAKLHVAAWKAMFDDYLRRRAESRGEAFQPFDPVVDYRRYVDGKPRQAGVVDFLASRGILLPSGRPDDPPERDTVYGLGNRKNRLYLKRMAEQGVETYPSTLALIRALRSRGFRTAVVTASKNCTEVLDTAGIAGLFDARVDGLTLEERGLAGKPAPDSFLEAARRLGAEPARAVVLEDAIAGVAAGQAGGFGCVIGVDRAGQAEALRRAGADVVVADLAEVGAR
jgi:beta-phosphoglucomutase family hydrolase